VLSILAEKNNFCSEYKGNAGIVMDFITPLGHPVLPKKHQWEQIKSIAGVTGKKTLLGNGELSCFITF
jgi:CTP:molybdopterin cytidylyltransferase MocA